MAKSKGGKLEVVNAVAGAVVAAPQATVLPPMTESEWYAFGIADATEVLTVEKRVARYAELLKSADYSKWRQVRSEYVAGAAAGGFKRPDDLWSRMVVKPLRLIAVTQPRSVKSSKAGVAKVAKPKALTGEALESARAKNQAAQDRAALLKRLNVVARAIDNAKLALVVDELEKRFAH